MHVEPWLFYCILGITIACAFFLIGRYWNRPIIVHVEQSMCAGGHGGDDDGDEVYIPVNSDGSEDDPDDDDDERDDPDFWKKR